MAASTPQLSVAAPLTTTTGAASRAMRDRLLVVFAGPVLVALFVGALQGVEAGAIALATLLGSSLVIERQSTWSPLLPLAGHALWCARPMITFIGLEVALVTHHVDLSQVAAAGLAAAAALPGMAVHFRSRRQGRRICFVGSVEGAARLQAELDNDRNERYTVAAVVVPPSWGETKAEGFIPVAPLTALEQVVARQRFGLIVVAGSRAEDDEIRVKCRATGVPVLDLPGFHEEAHGAVPVAHLQPEFFEGLAERTSSRGHRFAKRTLDLAVSVPLAFVALPIIAVFAVLVRRDGGPAFFRQERVGRNGEAFTLYKLRSMTVAKPDAESVWTASDDARVTKVGALMRRTHLDELPQLLSILSGSMTLVGPRPEQVSYTERLNGQLPFYAKRTDVKPGLTGWAQVRCGYAGSLEGSAFKLCNDFYYLKNASVTLDIAILFETVRALVADEQYGAAPATADTMLGTGGRRLALETTPAAAAVVAAVANDRRINEAPPSHGLRLVAA